jgi:hypothetical protein
MKMHQLERRVRKVESILRCEPQPTADLLFALLWIGVAYYLGNPSRDERPFAAYARALGYANESELNSAIEGKSRELPKRFLTAEEKLYAKFGFDDRSDDWGRLTEFLKRIRAGLPKSYQKHIARVLEESKVSLTWMRNENRDIGAYIRCFA